MTENQIKGRIAELESEAALLQKTQADLYNRHQAMVKQFQDQTAQNQTRYAQIQGAVGELKTMLEEKPEDNGSHKRPVKRATASRLPVESA